MPQVTFNTRISPELSERIDLYIEAQKDLQPDPRMKRLVSKSNLVETAVREYLDRKERKGE